MHKPDVREKLKDCIKTNEHCIKYGFAGDETFLDEVVAEYKDNQEFIGKECDGTYDEEMAIGEAIYTVLMRRMPKEEPENQGFVYECFWNWQFGEESLTIAKIPASEKDLDQVNESLGASDGYSFYYCDTLKEAVKSISGLTFSKIKFGNISDEEIEQVKKEL